MTMTSGAEGVIVDNFGAQPKVTIDGTVLSENEMSSLLTLEVESVTGRPDLCEIRMLQSMDQQGTPAGDIKGSWAPGGTLEVTWATELVFSGEITSVDFAGGNAAPTEIILLAFDKRHRMYRGDTVKAFKGESFRTIVDTLLGTAIPHDVSGLPGEAIPYYLHDGTVGDLVERLCDQYSLHCLWQNGKMVVKKPSDLTAEAGVLRGTTELLDFRFRQTTSADRANAEVWGWDPKKKESVAGKAARSQALPPGGLVASVDTNSDFAKQTLRHSAFIGSQTEADALALGALAGNVDAGIQLDATATLLPKLSAGKLIKVEAVPARFVGKYRLTSVRHRFDLHEGGRTTITCRGADDTTLTGLLEQAVLGGMPAGALGAGIGLHPALVVKVKSVVAEGALGADGAAAEVKVSLPWIGDQLESGWLRVVTVGGGKQRGLMVMPEKGDEVLVAFEDADYRRGYVLGGLYNTKDPAPRNGAVLGEEAIIHERVWKSKAGHEIVLGDKSGAEYVQIKSSDEKMTIRMDVKDGLITIDSKVDLLIAAEGDIGIEAKGAIGVSAMKDLVLEGQNVKITGKQNVDVKATANATVEGTTGAALKGLKVDINASTAATVKGNPIMLN